MSATRTPPEPRAPSREELEAAADVLDAVAQDRGLLAALPEAERKRFLRAVSKVHNPDARALRRLAKATARQEKIARLKKDDRVLNETGIRALRRRARVHDAQRVSARGLRAEGRARRRRARARPSSRLHCYVCKQKYAGRPPLLRPAVPAVRRAQLPQAHRAGRPARPRGAAHRRTREDRLPDRAEAAARRRARSSSPRVFPRNAASRYADEPDFAEWGHRLEVFGLDLRHTPSVEAFCRELLATRPRLDFIINNACQTVRRPPDFYTHMMAEETAALADMPDARPQAGGRRTKGCAAITCCPRVAARPPEALERGLSAVSGLAESARLSQVALLPEELLGAEGSLSRGPPRSGPAAGGSARPQLVAAAARRSVRPWSCSRCSSSTPWRRSSSTRG